MIVQHKSTLLITCQHAANDVSDRNPKPCKDEPQDIADRAGGACSWPTDNGAPKRPDHVGGQSPRSYAERSSYHQERHDHSREGVTDRQPQASDAEPEVVANGLHNRQHRTRVVDAAPCGEGEIEYRRGAGPWSGLTVGTSDWARTSVLPAFRQRSFGYKVPSGGAGTYCRPGSRSRAARTEPRKEHLLVRSSAGHIRRPFRLPEARMTGRVGAKP